jgi:hypothetical protein
MIGHIVEIDWTFRAPIVRLEERTGALLRVSVPSTRVCRSSIAVKGMN